MVLEGAYSHQGIEAFDGHIRRAGINPNCWYMIAKSSEIHNRPVGGEIWRQRVVLFRSSDGTLRALEDRCAHRMVRLSHGRVIDGAIECEYHGWRFDEAGRCVHIPHLVAKPVLPDYPIRSFPVVERHGFIWIWPGDPADAVGVEPMAMTEWDDLNTIPSVARLECRAHFSYLIENLMDMYHGRLHAQYQVWNAESLREVLQSENAVVAKYDATTHYQITGLESILQLFIPWLRKLHKAPLTVTYEYPNWRSTLGDDFKIFCLICPVNERLTNAFLIHYTSLHKFASLNQLPLGARRLIKRALSNVARKLLQNLVRQDVVMIEEEQAAFDENPLRQPCEVNRTLLRVQQLIRQQALKGPALD